MTRRSNEHDAHVALVQAHTDRTKARETVVRLAPVREAGCTSACEWGQDCTCSHAAPWQPKPKRLPGLGLRLRISLLLTQLRASFPRR